MIKKSLIIILLLLSNIYSMDRLKVGVLAFGTVNWELDVIKQNNLDIKNGYELEIVELASKNASSIAIQSGSVDIIVTDWLWVNKQKNMAREFYFSPYSKANGTIYSAKNSKIKTIADLEGKNLGFIGIYDKSWLIFKAYTKKIYQKELDKMVNITLASPPILYKKLSDESLDAAINFWHFNAKVKATGAKELISFNNVLNELDINEKVSFIGWVFNKSSALKNSELYNKFLNSSKEAKNILLNSDSEWERLKPKMRVKNDEVFLNLKSGFRKGVVFGFEDVSFNDYNKVFSILKEESSKEFINSGDTLSKDIFWGLKE